LVCADDIILGGSIHNTEKNTKALLVASKVVGLEVRVNSDKTKYLVMSQYQNAGRSHNIKIDRRKSSGIWEQP
jgi:hypothetical protein